MAQAKWESDTVNLGWQLWRSRGAAVRAWFESARRLRQDQKPGNCFRGRAEYLPNKRRGQE